VTVQIRARSITRTDLLVQAVAAELERHRDSLDQDCCQKVTLSVKLNEAGFPQTVFLTRESVHDLRSGGR
jgi:hypothetical protein